MNSTLGIWLIGAGVAVLAIVLLLGGLGGEREVSSEAELTGEQAVASPTYWQPVENEGLAPVTTDTLVRTATTVSAPASMATRVTAPCSGCGAAVAAASRPPTAMVGGCGLPSTPCARPRCSVCESRPSHVVSVAAPMAPAGRLVGGCAVPDTPCRQTCYLPQMSPCYDLCADPCHVLKPGINRNMPLCVDECSFLQLRSTVAHPICGQVCFQWSASKGWFLDPTVSDPLYFAPTTPFCYGEDVWITLLVTDASGAQYSDVVSLHVRDLP